MVGLAQQDSVDTGVCGFGAPAPGMATEKYTVLKRKYSLLAHVFSLHTWILLSDLPPKEQ